MKPLILTNHSLDKYAFRTGRKPCGCAEELINGIKSGEQMTLEEVQAHGFSLTKVYSGDTYHVWYDSQIKDHLLAIVSKTGAVVTILRKEMYGSLNPKLDMKYIDREVKVYGSRKRKRVR